MTNQKATDVRTAPAKDQPTVCAWNGGAGFSASVERAVRPKRHVERHAPRI